MTSEHRVFGVMRRWHAWLAVTIAAAVLSGQIAQPVMARRWPTEVANATVQRDIVYERVGGRDVRLDLYYPPPFSGPLPVIIWIHGAAGTEAEKRDVGLLGS